MGILVHGVGPDFSPVSFLLYARAIRQETAQAQAQRIIFACREFAERDVDALAWAIQTDNTGTCLSAPAGSRSPDAGGAGPEPPHAALPRRSIPGADRGMPLAEADPSVLRRSFSVGQPRQGGQHRGLPAQGVHALRVPYFGTGASAPAPPCAAAVRGCEENGEAPTGPSGALCSGPSAALAERPRKARRAATVCCPRLPGPGQSPLPGHARTGPRPGAQPGGPGKRPQGSVGARRHERAPEAPFALLERLRKLARAFFASRGLSLRSAGFRSTPLRPSQLAGPSWLWPRLRLWPSEALGHAVVAEARSSGTPFRRSRAAWGCSARWSSWTTRAKGSPPRTCFWEPCAQNPASASFDVLPQGWRPVRSPAFLPECSRAFPLGAVSPLSFFLGFRGSPAGGFVQAPRVRRRVGRRSSWGGPALRFLCRRGPRGAAGRRAQRGGLRLGQGGLRGTPPCPEYQPVA